jgi:basic amino acid/polyamine antiporter, APA family
LAPGPFGISGIFAGAALVFFAFIGFDIVATVAEEAKQPQRNMKFGIIGSLIICTVLYVAVSFVVTGMVKYTDIQESAPLAEAFRSVGRPEFATLVSVGALLGLTTVILILLLGQSRLFFAMSRDELIPPLFSVVNQRFRTPIRASLAVGLVVAVLATLIPFKELTELVNIGTLFAFVLVAIGVMVLRRTRPDMARGFRCPYVPAIPILAALISFYLMLNLSGVTWIRFIAWMIIGLIVYFIYGYRHSRQVRRDEI